MRSVDIRVMSTKQEHQSSEEQYSGIS